MYSSLFIKDNLLVLVGMLPSVQKTILFAPNKLFLFSIKTFVLQKLRDALQGWRGANQLQVLKHFISGLISVCFVIHQYILIFFNISQYLSLSLNISQYLTISLNISQYLSLSLNISQYLSISLNISQYISTSPNIS